MIIKVDKAKREALIKAKRLHFVGIGGVSISSLALLAINRGYTVSGSDRSRSPLTEKCERAGIKVIYGHYRENVADCDVLVYTAAVNMSNPELAEADRLGIPLVSRADFLGFIMTEYENRIGISGTHGKTTTTSMLSHILLDAGKDPTVANGAVTEELGGTLGIGGKELFVYESCEYKDSFLSFFPTVAIITNIELDHTDYYPSLEAIIRSFKESVKSADTVIVNYDDENALTAVSDFGGRKITVSLSDANATYYTKNLRYEDGRGVYTLCSGNDEICEIRLSVIGAFNVYNSLCASAAALLFGVAPKELSASLRTFRPAKRRFEIKREQGGVMIADDYAHHPSEIAATLKGVRGIGRKRVICIFQPHTYTRTKDLFDDFASALSLADITVLADIYAARETDTLGVSSELLAAKIKNGKYFSSFEEITEYVISEMKCGDLVLTMGAGDVFKVGELIMKKQDEGKA